MKILNIILAIIIVTTTVFMLVTKNFVILPFYVLALGVFLLTNAVRDIRNKENEFGAYMNVTVFFVLFVYFIFLIVRS